LKNQTWAVTHAVAEFKTGRVTELRYSTLDY